MTLKVCGNIASNNYNVSLAQTAFHELGHASMYRAVGVFWWLDVIVAEIGHRYGNPDYPNYGKVQVAESWAEFIGTDNALRRYPSGTKFSTMLRTTIPFSRSIEEEDWFSEDWIPEGVYFDLIDKGNTNSRIQEDNFDRVSGSSIRDLYSVFNSRIGNMCDYRNQFVSRYPQFNAISVQILFNHYQLHCK